MFDFVNYFPYSLSVNYINVFTKSFKIIIARITIMGEKSIPPKLIGSLLLMGYKMGSVAVYKNLTMGL